MGKKSPTTEHAVEDSIFERHVYEAMKQKGWIIPLTEDDVRRTETQLESKDRGLPDRLADPYALLSRAREANTQVIALEAVQQAEIEENLARAARDGRSIPSEIEQKMEFDRRAAERGSDDV